MREIKFRAWDDRDGKGAMICWELILEDGFHNYYGIPGVTLMQFTGLKDKNGKEVCEGDILQFVFEGEVFHTVPVQWREEFSVWGCMIALSEIEPDDIWVKETQYEAIGNIYENPDMVAGEWEGMKKSKKYLVEEE